jgi:hypothetical protein
MKRLLLPSKILLPVILLVLVLGIAGVAAACASEEATTTGVAPADTTEEQPAEQPTTEKQTTEEQTTEEQTDITVAGSGIPVLMLGRSVMWGWFKHWGWDGAIESMPFNKDGYSLTYRELAPPPDIATSATGFMDEAPEGSVVFFKFCFDDFPGAEEAASRFEEQKAWIQQVVEKAQERNQTLIIGNALPKVAMSTDPTLAAEHRDYNAWLNDYAASGGSRVRVYDFYSILTDPDGAEKTSYASAADDSHPNDEAYTELDPSFFKLLDEIAR